MQVTLINNILHVRVAGRSGRAWWVPAPGLRTHRKRGSLTLTCKGKRPPLRALRGYRPQVQACALPSPRARAASVTDTAVRESAVV